MNRAGAAMTAHDAVRPPVVAGQFYAADPRALAREIGDFFGQCSADIPAGIPVALISPHAGYRYSGPTAAEGYNAVRSGTFDTVIVISPSHREYFDGISVYPGKSYATPLGELPVDGDLRRALTAGDDVITVSEAGHRGEHAIEVQLPFIITLFGPVPFLPVVMGDQRAALCRHLGKKLAASLAGRKALIGARHDQGLPAREGRGKFLPEMAAEGGPLIAHDDREERDRAEERDDERKLDLDGVFAAVSGFGDRDNVVSGGERPAQIPVDGQLAQGCRIGLPRIDGDPVEIFPVAGRNNDDRVERSRADGVVPLGGREAGVPVTGVGTDERDGDARRDIRRALSGKNPRSHGPARGGPRRRIVPRPPAGGLRRARSSRLPRGSRRAPGRRGLFREDFGGEPENGHAGRPDRGGGEAALSEDVVDE